MVFQYFSETKMLYIKISDSPSVESEEVAPGVVVDFDEQGHVVGIEIEDADSTADLSRLEVAGLPIANLILVREKEPMQS